MGFGWLSRGASTGGLFSVPRDDASSSPTVNPGNFSTQQATEIDRSVVEREFGGSRPQLELVALAVTLMAVVATVRHVD